MAQFNFGSKVEEVDGGSETVDLRFYLRAECVRNLYSRRKKAKCKLIDLYDYLSDSDSGVDTNSASTTPVNFSKSSKQRQSSGSSLTAILDASQQTQPVVFLVDKFSKRNNRFAEYSKTR